MALLTFDQVTMRASTGLVEILKAISGTVHAGDFVGLVGPSGAGKTSLLRLINRLSETSCGTIFLSEQDIRQRPVVELRRQVALVMQESRLLGMSVRQTLAYPLKLQGQTAAETHQTVSQWTERLKIPSEWLNRTAVNLSLGQRQRVAIARALISNPQILLLDEPTSAQDVGYGEFLLARLALWAKQDNRAVIMANHQVELVSRHVNRLWHLQAGQLIQDLPAHAVNWSQLQQTLIEAEQQTTAEWE